ncbi:hypothetical protein ACO2RV_07465 [Ancylobacter sp. VNQ12]|uniref:hypothetical protein n=1 Tax=Ancylobacter sp. VNQ12 TaxID=3400920 RepID=UPI003BFCC083
MAMLGASLLGGVSLVLTTAPASAQALPPAPAANASPALKAAWAKGAVAAIISYYSDPSRITQGAGLAEAIQNLLLNNPTLAGDLATEIVNVGDQTQGTVAFLSESGGSDVVFVSPSLSIGLAKGLAYAVSTWQAQVNANPNTTSVAQAALTAVNGAFAAAQLSPGSLFGRTFASAASETGDGLLPPSLVDPDSPEAVLQLTVLPPPKITSNNVPSPNQPAL